MSILSTGAGTMLSSDFLGMRLVGTRGSLEDCFTGLVYSGATLVKVRHPASAIIGGYASSSRRFRYF